NPQTRLVDTHAHLHFANFQGEVEAVLHRSDQAGVKRLITVGVNTADSRQAASLAQRYESVWATVGIHPHDAAEAETGIDYLRDLACERKVVAIGECGLDYARSLTTKREQERALRLQLELALERQMPVVFHVREAFKDFWPIIDSYKSIRGVLHSF